MPSVAKKFDSKVAKLLPKLAKKVAILKNLFKTSSNQISTKSSQNPKSPLQKSGHQIAQKAAKLTTNRHIWQHCLCRGKVKKTIFLFMNKGIYVKAI